MRSLTDMVHRTEDYEREQKQGAQNVADIGDMAVESYTKEFLFGKSEGDRHILQQIQEALARIDDQSYGICANCEGNINTKRLEAVPWTPFCVRCQDQVEKGLLEK